MSNTTVQDLLGKLVGASVAIVPPGGREESNQIVASVRGNDPSAQTERQRQQDDKLNALLGRIAKISGQLPEQIASTAAKGTDAAADDGVFYPKEPSTFEEAKLTDSDVEALVLKFLLAHGDATGAKLPSKYNWPSSRSKSCFGR